MSDAHQTCSECGASADRRDQCPRCGALISAGDDLGLDIDEDALRRPAAAGVDSISDAQVGATARVDAGGAPATGDELSLARPAAPPPEPESPSFAERERSLREQVWRLGAIPLLLILGAMTASQMFADDPWIFLDNVNVLLHEAGHVLFGFDGQTLAALGGTLGQLMWPVIFGVYFWRWQRERVGAIVCLWWFGENLVNIARYMRDAVVQALPLIGGDQHDWTFLFTRWGVLDKSTEIARVTHWIGCAIMLGCLAALVWWTIRPSERELLGREV